LLVAIGAFCDLARKFLFRGVAHVHGK
jgi:hypothetical protein